MVNVQKFPFTYEVTAPKNGGTSEINIDTPWLDESGDWQSQIERDEIYSTNELLITEQKYDNGFHVMFIQTADKVVIKSNWALDYNERE
ncbi:hypothetical protein PYH72_07945 [Staphylococcus delphini]|uniref:hypothetical protein n=1 Tax=Staphylococcus delphini TaxID=53344 RepID=UPI0033652D04